MTVVIMRLSTSNVTSANVLGSWGGGRSWCYLQGEITAMFAISYSKPCLGTITIYVLIEGHVAMVYLTF